MRRRWLQFGLVLSLAACQPDDGLAQADDLPIGAGFDFYVLSLSWSPSYCAVEGDDANRQQCSGARFHGFVVHGLWPQFERGYPENCRTNQPLDMPRDRVALLTEIMPSSGLVRHQWRKHGSCSGLSQHDYFEVVRKARERVAVPNDYRAPTQPQTVQPDLVEDTFLASNPGMAENGIAITCDGRYLREVRICLTKALDFRSCEEVDRRSCHLPSALLPALR